MGWAASRWRRACRRTRAAALATVLLGAPVLSTALGAPPAAAESFTGDAAAELAERYAPIVMVVAQEEPCDDDGEPYAPMSVDAVLGNPQIALRMVGSADPVVTWGPTAADLYGRGAGFYLDFPGDALEPGCLYEQDARRYADGRPPTVYAHVVSQDDRPGRIVVEYWIYWYFNDWNNKHESDWEGIQVVFPAATPEEALTVEPTEVGYAQHEGGERAAWDAEKLERRGDRPVVYSSRGSHGSYFEDRLHLGRSGSEGFGCDTTKGPSTEIDPAVVLLPGAPTGAADPFAWLGFDGHWGERHGGPFDGPAGPATKGRWDRPLDWQDDLRSASASLPSPSSRSASIVDTFCDAVGWGSNQLLSALRSPERMVLVLAVLAVGAGWLLRRTAWTSTAPLPLVARRRNGQIARTVPRMFARDPWAFLTIGLAAVPMAVVFALVTSVLQRLPVLSDLADSSAPDGIERLVLAVGTSALASAATFTVVGAAVTVVMRDRTAGERPSWADVLRRLRAVARDLGTAFAIAALIVVVTGSAVVLAPIGVYVLVRSAFIAQAAVAEDPPEREPGGLGVLAASGRVARGRWWHTALGLVLVGGTTKVVSTLVGLAALVFLSPPFWALSALVVAVDAALAPLAAIAASYLYGDAAAQAAERATGDEPGDGAAAVPGGPAGAGAAT